MAATAKKATEVVKKVVAAPVVTKVVTPVVQ